jgi:hypothetical protein
VAKSKKAQEAAASQAPKVEVVVNGAPATEEVLAPTLTDDKDSLGNPKEPELIGPRGPNVPRGIKPEPVKKELPQLDVTDKVDSAGTETLDEHSYIPGPRGPFAAQHIKDSYRS